MKITQVSKKYGIPASTLRYYDSAGFFPDLKRDENGNLEFGPAELGSLKVIECLKKSGLTIGEIGQFFELCKNKDTLGERYELFNTRLKHVEEEIEKLEETKRILEYKKWYYKQALELGSEEAVNKLTQIPSKYAQVKKLLGSN